MKEKRIAFFVQCCDYIESYSCKLISVTRYKKEQEMTLNPVIIIIPW